MNNKNGMNSDLVTTFVSVTNEPKPKPELKTKAL